MSKSDVTHEEQETSQESQESWTSLTANGSITATEEGNVCVKDQETFLTVQSLKDSTAVVSLRKLCEEHE